jgi:hypothetical protein
MIQIRRHPLISTAVPALGLIGAVCGLYLDSVWIMAPGILLVVLGALQMITPVAVIDQETVQLKNLFGMVRAEYKHDGLEFMEIRGDKLFIKRDQQIAHLHQLKPKRLHQSDWRHLEETLLKARELAKKRK